jgi:hypothetical protein
VDGVLYLDARKREHLQRAKAVVHCANGGETPRLLLTSKSNLHPQGLANSSGLGGKFFMQLLTLQNIKLLSNLPLWKSYFEKPLFLARIVPNCFILLILCLARPGCSGHFLSSTLQVILL